MRFFNLLGWLIIIVLSPFLLVAYIYKGEEGMKDVIKTLFGDSKK